MEKIVISVGGSLIHPGKLDIAFLKGLKKVICKNKTKRIILVTGGGHLAREYMALVKAKGKHAEDTLGIACTQLNALLLATYFGGQKRIPRNFKECREMLPQHKLLICGGFHEDIATTSDGIAAELARLIGAKMLVNLTNVKGLYTKDPHKYKDAHFIPHISHTDFQKILVRHTEKPGQHFVLDTHAANICRENSIRVVIIQGLKNLEHLLQGRTFFGTVIS